MLGEKRAARREDVASEPEIALRREGALGEPRAGNGDGMEAGGKRGPMRRCVRAEREPRDDGDRVAGKPHDERSRGLAAIARKRAGADDRKELGSRRRERTGYPKPVGRSWYFQQLPGERLARELANVHTPSIALFRGAALPYSGWHMLDIHFIRENADLVKAGAQKKRMTADVDGLLALDEERKRLRGELDEKRAEQNRASGRIALAKGEEREKLLEAMRQLKAGMQEVEEKYKTVMADWQALMLTIPNIPDMSVPEGESDADNKEVKVWGEPTTFDFEPKDHVTLMTELGMADFERGSKVAGFRGYFLKGDGVLLANAVWQLALKHFGGKGMTPLLAPSLVRRETFMGTGYLPQGEEDLYKTQDGDYLAGTAEVATMGYYMDETLDLANLPVKFLAFSPCFRREAGAHGKDVRGLIRVHEFFKWEQVILCEASHEESVRMHEWLNRNTEEFIELLKIPYHTVANCGGDLGLGQVKKYDIELWVPGEQKYREISSASYFHDFQTRRLNIRYRDQEGNMRFAHSLNSTAIPTPRILVSIIENYQQKDGTIRVPDALVPYVGKEILGHNS